jgi:hypothetical protein
MHQSDLLTIHLSPVVPETNLDLYHCLHSRVRTSLEKATFFPPRLLCCTFFPLRSNMSLHSSCSNQRFQHPRPFPVKICSTRCPTTRIPPWNGFCLMTNTLPTPPSSPWRSAGLKSLLRRAKSCSTLCSMHCGTFAPLRVAVLLPKLRGS